MGESGSPFTEACERCGSFAPLTRSFEAALCADCVRKSVHEIALTPLDFVHALKGLGQILVRVGLVSALVAVAFELPHAVLARFVALPPLVDLAWGQLTVTASDVVAIQLAWQVVRGRRSLDYAGSFRSAFEVFPRVLFARLLAGIVTVLWALLLVVPGVVRSLSLFLVTPVAAFEQSDPAAAMSRSTSLMKGHRWLALGTACLALVPFASAMVTAGIAYVAAAISSQAEAAPMPLLDFAGDVLGPVLILPVTLLPIVFYAKLAPPAPDLR